MTDNSGDQRPHGVVMTGDDGRDGPKALYIVIDG
jgi:hypothetical protein